MCVKIAGSITVISSTRMESLSRRSYHSEVFIVSHFDNYLVEAPVVLFEKRLLLCLNISAPGLPLKHQNCPSIATAIEEELA